MEQHADGAALLLGSGWPGLLDVVWWPSTGVVNRSHMPMSQMPAPDLLAGHAGVATAARGAGTNGIEAAPGRCFTTVPASSATRLGRRLQARVASGDSQGCQAFLPGVMAGCSRRVVLGVQGRGVTHILDRTDWWLMPILDPREVLLGFMPRSWCYW